MRLSALEREEFGHSPPSTAGWMFPGRDLGPAIGTDPHRTLGTRDEAIFLSPAYDGATGKATASASPLLGFVRNQRVGYKTSTLRNGMGHRAVSTSTGAWASRSRRP